MLLMESLWFYFVDFSSLVNLIILSSFLLARLAVLGPQGRKKEQAFGLYFASTAWYSCAYPEITGGEDRGGLPFSSGEESKSAVRTAVTVKPCQTECI